MAVEAVNKDSDTLPSVLVSMLPYGTQCQSEKTLDMYSGLIQDNVKPLAGKLMYNILYKNYRNAVQTVLCTLYNGHS